MVRTTQVTTRVTNSNGKAEDDHVDQALHDVYEAYQVFCAYGTHPTSWKNLAIQLHLYFETAYPGGLPIKFDKPVFARVIGKLDTYQLAYLLSDTLLAFFYLSSLTSTPKTSWLRVFQEDQRRCDEFEFRNLLNNDLPYYLSRRYLPKIPTKELLTLLLTLRQETHNRDYLSHSLFCIDKSWSPAAGCFPSILLHCSVQLPAHVSSALVKYAVQTGTYESTSGMPKSRTELRTALLRIPKLLVRAATFNPEQPKGSGLQEQPLSLHNHNPYSIEIRRQKLQENFSRGGKFSNNIIVDQAQRHARNSTVDNKNGAIIPSLNRVRALSFDSLRKVDGINPPRVAFDQIWRQRKVTSWPTIASAVDENQEENSYPDISSEATDDTPSEHATSSVFSPTESMFGSIASNTSVEEEACEPAPNWPLQDALEQEHVDFCKDAKANISLPQAKSVPCDQDADLLPLESGTRLSLDRSSISTHQSFVTANSNHGSLLSFQLSSQNKRESFLSYDTFGSVDDGAPQLSDYLRLLQQCDLIPEPMIETNWSGRGQHAEYSSDERELIPLETEKILGQTRTAVVDSVRCKRVRLVRKIIHCNRRTRVKREEAVSEVQHLYRAQHCHIVRLVGTYVIEDQLAILTYPCAEWDLQIFLSTAAAASDAIERAFAIRKFFTCLAKVLDFMHSFPIKHMDIKPQNLLVRDIRHCAINGSDPYKIYITDFGISRSYGSAEECDTETPTSFTRTYAAMEVVLQESRGLAADIFSLACVYSEMLATVLDLVNIPENSSDEEVVPKYLESLQAARTHTESGLKPYYSVIPQVSSWLSDLPIYESELNAVRGWILKMLDNEASNRPTARQISDDPHLPFSCLSCSLRSGPEEFEAA